MSGGAKVGHWTCLDCDWRGYVGAAIRHERQKFHRVAPEPAPDPSASAASPLCSCGARAVEDGGTEGVCECCTDCERGEPLTDEERRRLLTPPEVTP